jgi:lipid-A-disaccharide synthase-like uncharacterized protein
MNSKLLFSILFIVQFLSCKKDNNYVFSSSLIGEWSWFSTCGGFLSKCYTPISTNKKINLVFTVDSIYNEYMNDTLNSSNRYHTFKIISADGKKITNILKYDSGYQVVFSIIHDTLDLDDGSCCDGYRSYYSRINR